MSFSFNAKEELSKINNLAKKDQVFSELIGYFLSCNTVKFGDTITFSTESQYNINRYSKLLRNCGFNDFEIDIKGKAFHIDFSCKKNQFEIWIKNINSPVELLVNNIIIKDGWKSEELLDKALVRGVFLGSGYISNPERKYHLELNFNCESNADFIKKILAKYNIKTKKLKKEKCYTLYIKEGEEISKFLAFVGANMAVLKFEETRVIRDAHNNVNRLINCETANLTKSVNAAERQIKDIEFLMENNKFVELPENVKEVANIRLKHPDSSLIELIKIMGNKISKSGLSHRLAVIKKKADELRGELDE